VVPDYGRLLWAGRRWIAAAMVLFVAGCLLGYVAASAEPELVLERLRPILRPTFARIGEIGERVTASPSALERTYLIFRNNVTVGFWMIVGGLVLGIVPAAGVLINGVVIGLVTALGAQLAPREASPWLLFLAVAPHGIFELPAIWLCIAWGMKLGLAWLRPPARGRRWGVFRSSALEAAQVFALAAVLLLVAAAIEGNVTLSMVRALRA
jgi:stage II sporulation protein M